MTADDPSLQALAEPTSRRVQALRAFKFFRQLLGYPRLAKILCSSFLLSAMELIGLALIFPLLRLATDDSFQKQVADVFSGTMLQTVMASRQTSLLVAGSALIFIYLIKGGVQTLLMGYQAASGGLVNAAASQDIVSTALAARYAFFQKHGGVKVSGISYSNTTHAALLLQAAVSAINELVLIALIVVSAFLVAPWISLGFSAVMVVLACVMFRPVSKRIGVLGRKAHELDLARHRFTFSMASAIRDIKIMGLEAPFSSRNRFVVEQFVGLTVRYQTLGAAIRIAVETTLMLVVVLACVGLGYTEANLVELAPALGAMALAAARLAPATSRLVVAYNAFWYSLPFVEALLEMKSEIGRYGQLRTTPSPPLPADLAVKSLSFFYGAQRVLYDVSFTVPKGSVVGIVGPSGSGKSTLLDLVAGLQQAASGSFAIDGRDFDPFTSTDFRDYVGYVPQSIALLDASLAFNVSLDNSPDPDRLHQALRQAHLLEWLDSLPAGLETTLGEGGQGVSGGQRQRIGIARALYRSPRLLILDEVTSALDAETERIVMDELLELKGQASLLIVTHRMQNVEHADVVYLMRDGELRQSESRSVGDEHV